MACPNGWEGVRHGEAGVSCVGLYDSHLGSYMLFDHDHVDECVMHMNTADVLVSFNGIEFDTPVLESVTGFSVTPPQYDVLHEIWRSLGTRVKGYKLGDVCGRLDLGAKTDKGETAPVLFENQQFGPLWGYCLNDVRLTRGVARFIWKNGYVLTPEMERLDVVRLEV